MKDIGGICELRSSVSCVFGIRLLAAATKLVPSIGAAGTRGHRGRLVQTVRSAKLHRDRLMRCDAGASCNHADRSTNDSKSPRQPWSASFTITAEEVHIDTCRLRFHWGIGFCREHIVALCDLGEFNGSRRYLQRAQRHHEPTSQLTRAQ